MSLEDNQLGFGKLRGKNMLKNLYTTGVKMIRKGLGFAVNARKATLRTFRRLIFAILRTRTKRRPQQIIFESRRGSGYICNPRDLYESLRDDPRYSSYTFVWVAQKPKKLAFLQKCPRTRVVKRHSYDYLVAFAQSKYWVANHMLADYIFPAKDQVYLQTWHGKPIKRIAADSAYTVAKGTTGRERRKKYQRDARKLSWLLAPAPVFAPIMAAAFGLKDGADDSRLLSAGYPRNVSLFTYTDDDIARLKEKFDLPCGKKIVLYTPTWRPGKHEKGVGYIYHNPLDFCVLKEELGDEYILLFRGHNLEAQSVDLAEYQGFVRDMTSVEDVNELYLVSDVMISDYSGTVFDYANLRRPMVYYLFDWHEYSVEQYGTYFDPHTFPGVVAEKEEELAEAIKTAISTITYDEDYKAFNEKFNPWEGVGAPKKLMEQVFPASE